jgi:hypothetical protein
MEPPGEAAETSVSCERPVDAAIVDTPSCEDDRDRSPQERPLATGDAEPRECTLECTLPLPATVEEPLRPDSEWPLALTALRVPPDAADAASCTLPERPPPPEWLDAPSEERPPVGRSSPRA